MGPVGILLLQLAVDEVIAEQKRFAARVAQWTKENGKPPFSVDVPWTPYMYMDVGKVSMFGADPLPTKAKLPSANWVNEP
jgi:hypothetical protein